VDEPSSFQKYGAGAWGCETPISGGKQEDQHSAGRRMMTNTLYCFGESGNAYKAALTLELSGTPWSPRFVDFFKGEARGPGFRAINPMGEVPVLDADGTILTQSGVIQDWVMDETGKLCGDGSKETRRDDELPARGETLGRGDRLLAGRLKASLAVLEGELATRDWLVGDGLTSPISPAAATSTIPSPSASTARRLAQYRRLADAHRGQPGWKHPYDLMPGNPSDRA
jgi:glutathione S-transferase